MGFLAPWFFAGTAALAVPLYLHLLRRHTSTPRPFSSLMFFEPRAQSSIRHRRLRYLLLLALRLALLALLVLAFADPFVNRPAAEAGTNRLMLLVIDNSFSMRAGARLAGAKREAIDVLASRPPAERAQVMTFGAGLRALTRPTRDPRALASAVESIQPSDGRGNFGQLARAAGALGENAPGPIVLHFFSDMQKSAMPASFADLALPTGVSLVLHPVVKSDAPNWLVENVNAPGEVWDPKKAVVEAVIAGYHTPAAARTVSLIVNGKTTQTRVVEVPAGGRATAEFDSLRVPYGFSRCELRIDSADSLPADDAFYFAVDRSDPKPVLFLHRSADTRSPLYFGAALAASAQSAFTMESVTADQALSVRALSVQPAKYAFVVLSDVSALPSSFENALLQYVRNGGGVLIAAGTSTGARSRIPIFGAKILGARNYAESGDRFLTVGEADRSYAPVGQANGWAGVKFYYAVNVDAAGARVAARLADQTPLLLDKRVGEGRVLLFTSGFGNLTNDFPLQPDFVPFVQQAAYSLAGVENRGGSRMVGSFLQLRSSKEQAVSVELIDPAGRRPLSLQEATTALSYRLPDAGFYELRLADGRQDVIGVNADRRESDLAVIPAETLSLWASRPAGPGPGTAASPAPMQVAQKYNPYPLWWYVMLLVLLVALAESWVANLHLGVRREGS
ncbi:MAG TPA: BatA and WFA domain-containing protein [Patescibacteria group bacterium]|nr:BatA and WFA domain-containing protein [Patescibacteria group bacterium]